MSDESQVLDPSDFEQYRRPRRVFTSAFGNIELIEDQTKPAPIMPAMPTYLSSIQQQPELIDFHARMEIAEIRDRLASLLLHYGDNISEMKKQLSEFEVKVSQLAEADRDGLANQRQAYSNVLDRLEPYMGKYVAISYTAEIIADDESELALMRRLAVTGVPPDSYFIYEVGSKIFGSRY